MRGCTVVVVAVVILVQYGHQFQPFDAAQSTDVTQS